MRARIKLSTEQKFFGLMLHDQVAFSRHFFRDELTKPLSTRQKLVANDQSKQVLLATGRKTAKCVAGDTILFDAETGNRCTVKELVERGASWFSVPTLGDDWRIHGASNASIFANEIVQVFRVITCSGLSIRVSGNHPFLTGVGWVECESLRTGDLVATTRRTPMPETDASCLSDAEVAVLAYLIGDGGISQNQPNFTTASSVILADFKDWLSQIDLSITLTKRGKYDYSIIGNRSRGNQTANPISLLLKKVGLHRTNSHTKFIPDQIFRLNQHGLSLFISRLFATDGYADEKQIGYCSVSLKLIQGIRELLSRYGIHAIIRTKRSKYKGLPYLSYHIEIADSGDILTFAREIGIFSKEDALQKCVVKAMSSGDSKHDRFPLSLIRHTIESNGISPYMAGLKAGLRFKGNYQPSRSKVRRVAKTNNLSNLMQIVDGDIYWDEIASVEPDGIEQTYDLTVPKTHNFVANGFITHNTILQIEGRVLRHSIQQHNKISERMIVTAGDKQLDPLRDRIATRIGRTPLFKMLLIEANKNAGIMRFAGGCIWYFRIEGTSGTDANMVGLRAEEIIMDETQLGNMVCHNSRLQTALPTCRFLYAGVPDGRRDSMFFKLDQTDMGKSWSHHKTSTYINPLYWAIEERDKLRVAYGGVNSPDYITQVLGQWGKSMLSVFPLESIAIHHNAYKFARIAGRDIPDEIGDSMARLKLAAKLQVPRVQADTIILGMDYGNKQDPTEIFLAYQTSVSGDWVQFMRIQVLGADDVQQAFLLQYLVDILGTNRMGKMSIDLASCGVGPVLRRITPLRQFWVDRLIDYNAGGKVEVVQEIQVPDGMEPTRQNRFHMGRKEWATRILQASLIAARNNVEAGQIAWIPNDEQKQVRRANNPRIWLADDEEVIQEMASTRSRKTESGYTVYLPPTKGPHLPIDHCTDASRNLALAALETQVAGEIDDDAPAVAMTNSPLFGVPSVQKLVGWSSRE